MSPSSIGCWAWLTDADIVGAWIGIENLEFARDAVLLDIVEENGERSKDKPWFLSVTANTNKLKFEVARSWLDRYAFMRGNEEWDYERARRFFELDKKLRGS